MVAMDVGDEYRVDFHRGHSEVHHLPLGTFTAVYQKGAPTYLQYLGALISFDNGHG